MIATIPVLRRSKAVLTIALVWAALWLPVGLVAGIILYGIEPPYDFSFDGHISKPPALPIIASATVTYCIWGAISGGAFAAILAFTERSRSLDSLSPRRLALLGLVAAVLLPAVIVVAVVLNDPRTAVSYSWFFITVTWGAVCGAIMLKLARRAPAAGSL